MRRLEDLDVRGARVFVRCDFNVPAEAGRVSDDTRIRKTLATIRWILERGGACVLASHFGRPKGPKGKDKGPDAANSLKPVAVRLSELLGRPVPLVGDCVGPEAERSARSLAAGEALLLENLRFHAGEEKNDPAFAASLASLADCYVNDAFGVSHRAHASIVGLPPLLPSGAGLLLQAEAKYLGAVYTGAGAERPFAAILGGAKVSDKIAVLARLAERVDLLFIGGAMAYTFLAADGVEIGKSHFESEMRETARGILARARARGVRTVLPTDHVTVETFDADAPTLYEKGAISAGRMGMDVGPETLAALREALSGARTVFWNGPPGVFEMPRFAKGTMELARVLAGMASSARVIVGGGDSAAAVEAMGFSERMTHVSTGGGASIEFLAVGTLPGIAALSEARSA